MKKLILIVLIGLVLSACGKPTFYAPPTHGDTAVLEVSEPYDETKTFLFLPVNSALGYGIGALNSDGCISPIHIPAITSETIPADNTIVVPAGKDLFLSYGLRAHTSHCGGMFYVVFNKDKKYKLTAGWVENGGCGALLEEEGQKVELVKMKDGLTKICKP